MADETRTFRLRGAALCAALIWTTAAAAGAQEEITFGDDEGAHICVLRNSADKEAVDRFAQLLYASRMAMGDNLQAAIDNFETTMSFSSEEEAKPQFGQVLLKTALDESVDAIASAIGTKVPGFAYVVKGIKAVAAEADRAAAAQANQGVGAWIRAQRSVVASAMAGGGSAGDGQIYVWDAGAINDAIMQELCPRIDDGTFRDGIDEILTAEGSLRAAGVPTEQRYRRALFEDWISANFSGFAGANRTRGTVRIFWEVDVDGDPNDYPGSGYPLVWDNDAWSAEVILPEPYGQRIAGGLNELGVSPVAAGVPKQVCFETDGIAGGTVVYCGVIQRSGSASSPVAPWAVEMFENEKWKTDTTSFRE